MPSLTCLVSPGRRLRALVARTLLTILTIYLFLSSRSALATTTIDLYSVGPGNYIFSKFGHSALCVTSDSFPKGRCYDFGVTDAQDAVSMVWGTMRSEPLFVTVAVDLDVLVTTFSEQERSIWKQTLPFDDAHASAFALELESALNNHARYAYDPAFDNCTTEIRDRLDLAWGGKLRAPGPPTSSAELSYREIVESRFSGRILELTVLAFAVGVPGDRHPDNYQAMFLPYDLRDAIEARLGVKAEEIHKRERGIELRTSTAVGRVTLVLIGLFLSAIVWAGLRPNPKREQRAHRAVMVVGITLGIVAVAVDLMAICVSIAWVRENWVLVLLWPTDLALGWLHGARRQNYLLVRLGALALFSLLSLTHVIAQPLVAMALFAALPLAVIYRAGRPVVAPKTAST